MKLDDFKKLKLVIASGRGGVGKSMLTSALVLGALGQKRMN